MITPQQEKLIVSVNTLKDFIEELHRYKCISSSIADDIYLQLDVANDLIKIAFTTYIERKNEELKVIRSQGKDSDSE